MERTADAKKTLRLYSGTSHPKLAEEVAASLGVTLGNANIRRFANGEIHCRFDESVRGSDVFIMQSHCDPINDSIMEQLIMIDAAKRGSAKRITAVCPQYGYARQDRKAEGREPISAKLIADLLTVAGASRMVSVDLHSGQIQGFFNGPVDHLVAMPVILDYLRREANDDIVVVSPDAGRVKVAERYSQHLGADLAFVHKRHVKFQADAVEARGVIGDVDGRQCVIIDDRIDTAGTLVSAADILLEHGATEVWAMATHGVLAGPAVERLNGSKIARIVITNTLPLPADKDLRNVEVLSVAGIIADAISAVFEDTSVSEIFGGENLSLTVEVIPRAEWAPDLQPTGPVPDEPDVRFLLVHHSVNRNDYGADESVGLLRSIYELHTGSTRGWPDIAYNFFVDRFGAVYEGRLGSLDRAKVVDATGGSQGFAQLACFLGDHSTEAPLDAAVTSMRELLAMLGDRYGVDLSHGATTTFVSRGSNRWPAGTDVTATTIAGHRDMSQTACPGDAAYALVTSGAFARGAQPATSTTSTSTTAEPTTTAAPSTTTASSQPPSSEQAAPEPAPAAAPAGDSEPWWPVPAAAGAAIAVVAGLIAVRRRRL